MRTMKDLWERNARYFPKREALVDGERREGRGVGTLERLAIDREHEVLEVEGQPVGAQVRRREHFSRDLNTGAVHLTVQVMTDESGPSELGGLCSTPAWLLVQPASIGISGPHLDRKDLRVDLAIGGKLLVAQGAPPKTKPTPLPALGPVKGPPGFAVHAQLSLPLAGFSDELDKQLKGLELPGRGLPDIKITHVKLSEEVDRGHPERITVRLRKPST